MWRNAGKNVGAEELLLTVGVSTKVTDTEISVEDSQKATQWPGYPTTQHTPKRLRRLDTYSVMYIAALVTIARKWDQPGWPSADERIWKCGGHTRQNFIRLWEIWNFQEKVWSWRSSLSNVTQTQRDKWHIMFLIHAADLRLESSDLCV